MTLFTKLGLSVLGGGSIVAGGYGTYELIRPKTIADQLKWEGKKLGDVEGTADDGEETGKLWKKLSDRYNSETNTDAKKKFKKLNEQESEEPTINSSITLKDHCKKILILKLSESNKDHLEKAKLWCVKDS